MESNIAMARLVALSRYVYCIRQRPLEQRTCSLESYQCCHTCLHTVLDLVLANNIHSQPERPGIAVLGLNL